jgi:hypothetical protein
VTTSAQSRRTNYTHTLEKEDTLIVEESQEVERKRQYVERDLERLRMK